MFVGIDLAWGRKNESGVCIMRCVDGRLSIDEVTSAVLSAADVGNALELLGDDVIAAIDGPIVVVNPSGRRDCERSLDAVFRTYHALTHSTNIDRLVDAVAGPELFRTLMNRGFRCSPLLARRAGGRHALEVYPHASQVVQFQLPERLLYKRKTKKRAPWRGEPDFLLAQLWILRGLLEAQLVVDGLTPDDISLLPPLPVEPPKESERKRLEDRLDAVSCAVIAFHAWRDGVGDGDAFGDADSGYIVVPGLSRDPRFARPAVTVAVQ